MFKHRRQPRRSNSFCQANTSFFYITNIHKQSRITPAQGNYVHTFAPQITVFHDCERFSLSLIYASVNSRGNEIFSLLSREARQAPGCYDGSFKFLRRAVETVAAYNDEYIFVSTQHDDCIRARNFVYGSPTRRLGGLADVVDPLRL